MTQREWKDIFSSNLLGLLEEKGMSQYQLAKDSKIAAATISDYINKRTVPGAFAIINMAYALDVEVNELIDFDERIY